MTDVIKPIFKIKPIKQKPNHARFIFEPLIQGYGHTVGNALRRCLLTSLPGAAITRLKIEGINHQFSTLAGVKEDMVDFILNLKQVKIDYRKSKEVKAILKARGPGEVKAGDIKAPTGVKIVNKSLKLATLSDKNVKLNVKLWINSGYGYSSVEERTSTALGIIPIDAIFTPIIKINYKVESTRVGRRTDFDKLILEIWTDGSIKPKEALENAAKTLVSFFKQIYNPVFEKEKKEEIKPEDNEVLKLTVEELNLPTRIANALRRGGYGTIKDLIKVSKEDISKVKNLGKKSIDTIIEKLAKKGVKIASKATK